MQEIVRSRKTGAMTPADRQRAESTISLLGAMPYVAMVAMAFSTLVILGVVFWQMRNQLSPLLLVAIAAVVIAGDVVAGFFIWVQANRQRAGFVADLEQGRVEEIICDLPEGIFWYNTLAVACNLPTGKQPGAGKASQMVTLVRRRLQPGQPVRLRILPACRLLLCAEPC